MSTGEENPIDKTPFGPPNPNPGNEDPFHGAEAVESLLAIPPLRNEDGTFHVFGGYYVCGTNTFDAEGRPFIKFKSSLDPSYQRELMEHNMWIDAFNAGELPPREEMELPNFAFDSRPYFVMDDSLRIPAAILDQAKGDDTIISIPFNAETPKPRMLGAEMLDLMREPDWRSDITIHIDTDSLGYRSGAENLVFVPDERFIIAEGITPSDVVYMVGDALEPPEDKIQASRKFYSEDVTEDQPGVLGPVESTALREGYKLKPDLISDKAESEQLLPAVEGQPLPGLKLRPEDRPDGVEYWDQVIDSPYGKLKYADFQLRNGEIFWVSEDRSTVITVEAGTGNVLDVSHNEPESKNPEIIATSFGRPYFKGDSDTGQLQGIVEQLDVAEEDPNLDDVLGIDPPIIEE